MQAHRGETVAPDPVLHDLKNLLTTVAALTVKVREEVVGSVSPQEAPHLHTALRDLGAAVGRTIALTRVSAPEEGSGGDLELSRYLEEHAPALGALLGQRDRLRLRIQPSAQGVHVQIDEVDLLRALIDTVRTIERAGCNVLLDLGITDVVVHSTLEGGEGAESVLHPRSFAVLRFEGGTAEPEDLAGVRASLEASQGALRFDEAGRAEFLIPLARVRE